MNENNFKINKEVFCLHLNDSLTLLKKLAVFSKSGSEVVIVVS